MSDKILISACLLGQPVRYDGKSKPIADVIWLQQLQQQNRLIVVCPEMAGGLQTPRPPAEKVGDQVITITGKNVTKEFNVGAEHALQLCKTNNIQYALLKAKSPSCGNKKIYNGEFSEQLTEGQGVTAKRLCEHGIQVFSELEIEQLKKIIQRTY